MKNGGNQEKNVGGVRPIGATVPAGFGIIWGEILNQYVITLIL